MLRTLARTRGLAKNCWRAQDGSTTAGNLFKPVVMDKLGAGAGLSAFEPPRKRVGSRCRRSRRAGCLGWLAAKSGC